MSSSPSKMVPPEPEQFASEVTNTDIEAGAEQVTIAVTKTDIAYDNSYASRTGWLKFDPDGSAPERLGDTVLHLLTFLIYTKEGHALLMDNPFNREPATAPGALPDTGLVKKHLMEVLHTRFPALDPQIIDVAIEAHFIAGRYVVAGNREDATRLQEIYKQKLIAILGALYDDMMGRDFSKAW